MSSGWLPLLLFTSVFPDTSFDGGAVWAASGVGIVATPRLGGAVATPVARLGGATAGWAWRRGLLTSVVTWLALAVEFGTFGLLLWGESLVIPLPLAAGWVLRRRFRRRERHVAHEQGPEPVRR